MNLQKREGPVTEPDDEGDRRRTYSLEIGLAKIEGKLDAIIASNAALTVSVNDLADDYAA